MFFKGFIVILLISAVFGVKKSYDGYKVYRVIPKTKDSVAALNKLQVEGIVESWDDQFGVNSVVKMSVAPEHQEMFLNTTDKFGIVTKELIEDMQRAIDNQMKPSSNARNTESLLSLSWDRYYSLEEIYAWLDELEAAYPNIVKTVVIGQTVENRDIKGIVLNYNPEREQKYIGMFEGALHAREWISPATVTWIIKEFLTSTDPAVRDMARSIEWHIFPVVNPDGYSYTFTNNRMWRKNRSVLNFTTCAENVDDDMSNGVDLNRNFGYVWMSEGASNDPCSNLFAGPYEFSEPETRAISGYVTKINEEGDFVYYIAFHSYTQLIIIPYSHLSAGDVDLPGNFNDMYEIAIRGAEKLSEREGTNYRVGVSEDVMYKMSGTSFDWVKYNANVPVTYLIELRDLGEFGFLLPAEQIIPSNLEIMDALLEMDATTRALGYYTGSASSVFGSAATVLVSVIAALLLVN